MVIEIQLVCFVGNITVLVREQTLGRRHSCLVLVLEKMAISNKGSKYHLKWFDNFPRMGISCLLYRMWFLHDVGFFKMTRW